MRGISIALAYFSTLDSLPLAHSGQWVELPPQFIQVYMPVAYPTTFGMLCKFQDLTNSVLKGKFRNTPSQKVCCGDRVLPLNLS